MLNESIDPHTAKRPRHSDAYEKGMALLFILGAVGALLAVLMVLSYFD
jgi:hypothetical protein